jgi:hypothetical protein
MNKIIKQVLKILGYVLLGYFGIWIAIVLIVQLVA